jgi:hypothetical protein
MIANSRNILWLSILLIGITIIRAGYFLFSTPVNGYANNYDFIQQSSCIGLWQDYPDRNKRSKNPDHTVSKLRLDGEKDRVLCMQSIDNLIPWAIARLHTHGDSIDLREISLLKLFLVCIGITLFIASKPTTATALVTSTAFFLTYNDIHNLLYFNTLYLESSVIFGLFFSTASLAIYLTISERPGFIPLSLASISIIWLGLSKQQYMPIASAISFTIGITYYLRWQSKLKASFFILIAALIPYMYSEMTRDDLGERRSINFANKTDTFLWAVLPEATNKQKALNILGLQDSCASAIGKSWYSPDIRELDHPCPDVEYLSRLRLIPLFIIDPRTFFQPIIKAIEQLPPFYPPYLAQQEVLEKSPPRTFDKLKWTSLSAALNFLPLTLAVYLISAIITSPAIVTIQIIRNKIKAAQGTATPPAIIYTAGGAISLYSIISSVFGDGYSEVQKHGVGFLIGASFQLSAIIILILLSLRKIHPRPH